VRLPALQPQPALQPEELFQNQPELRGRSKPIEKPQIASGGGEMHLAQRGPAVRKLQALPQIDRQMIFQRLHGFQQAVYQHAQGAGIHFPRRFVNRHDAAYMQGAFRGIFIVGGEQLHLGMQHVEIAFVGIELDLPEECEALPRSDAGGHVLSVEPLGHQHAAGTIGKFGFEQSEIAAAC
jgi:hypothetical protein